MSAASDTVSRNLENAYFFAWCGVHPTTGESENRRETPQHGGRGGSGAVVVVGGGTNVVPNHHHDTRAGGGWPGVRYHGGTIPPVSEVAEHA